jgi:hypothetical protein
MISSTISHNENINIDNNLNDIYICNGCDKIIHKQPNINFHKQICIFKNIKDSIIYNIQKLDIINTIFISNLLLFNNNINYPISKEKLLYAIIERKRYEINIENIDTIIQIYDKIYNDNNYEYNYENILNIIHILTNIRKRTIIEINNTYKFCKKNLCCFQ